MVARMSTERVFWPENCMGLVISAVQSFACERTRFIKCSTQRILREQCWERRQLHGHRLSLAWVTFSSGYPPVFCSFLIAATTVTVQKSFFSWQKWQIWWVFWWVGLGKPCWQEAEKGLLSQATNTGHSGLLNSRMWPLWDPRCSLRFHIFTVFW